MPTKQVGLESREYQVRKYNIVNSYDPVRTQARCANKQARPKQNLENVEGLMPRSYVTTVFSAVISNVIGDLSEEKVRYMLLQRQVFAPRRPSESFKSVLPQRTEAYHKSQTCWYQPASIHKGARRSLG